ncbi:MAG: very short patch repair endonuclease [Bacillota bacterium]
MTDTLTRKERSARMARVRGRDTKPEMVVRRLVHGLGFRYRLHDRRLPGAPDLVFKSRRKAIFIHGCFWHRHSDPCCKLARMPKSKLEFWRPKLEGNRERDLRNQSELDAIGWKYLVVWECELGHREQLENKLLAFLTEGDPE